MSAIRGLTCDNETGRHGAGNTTAALTHLSDLSRRGLAVSLPIDTSPDWDSRSWSGPLAEPRYREAVWRRILSKITRSDSDCWEWQGYRDPGGYGLVSVKRRMTGAHQVALAIHLGGLWPVDLQVDHLCRNRACCNPEHLEAVTPRENTVRGLGPVRLAERQASKTHCPQGHEYTAENTKFEGRGGRKCRVCIRARVKVWQRSRPPLEDNDPRHGTLHGYGAFRCRCSACRAVVARRARERRGAAALQVPSPAKSLATHCKRGHEFSDENTLLRKSGKRLCRSCRNETQRQYRAGRGEP